MNAIQLLKEDHKKVRSLLAELEATTRRAAKKRTDLLATIAREIEIHTTLEEEIFYPAFKQSGKVADDDKLYFEALEEHRAAGDMVLPDLQRTAPDSEQFSGRAKVLKELVEHHAGEEEREMFPRARELLSAAELRDLGERMAERKRQLLAAGKAVGAMKRAGGKLVGAVASMVGLDDELDDEDRGLGTGRRRAAAQRDGERASRAASASKASQARARS